MQRLAYIRIIGALILLFGFAASVTAQAQLRIPTGIVKRPPNVCKANFQPSPQPLIPFKQAELVATNEEITNTFLVSAGDVMALKVVAAAKAQPIQVSAYVKLASAGQFEKICSDVTWLPGRAGEVFNIGAPWHGPASVWRIELKTAKQPLVSAIQIEFLRRPGSEIDKEAEPTNEVWNNAYGLLCTDRVVDSSWQRKLDGFAGRVRLDVTIDNVAPDVDGSQMAAVERAILEAVPIWVNACEACRIEQMVVIDVNGRLFVRTGVRTWYGSNALISVGPRRVFDAASDKALKSALEPIVWLGAEDGDPLPIIKAFVPYEVVGDPKDEFKYLCLATVSHDDKVLLSVQRALCDPSKLASGDRAQIIVRFVHGKTYCGDSKEIIACRADPELTEYNMRDYRFLLPDDRTKPIGGGKMSFDFLTALAHEMGHWIGLRHIDSGESLMASSAEQARCINMAVVTAMLKGDHAPGSGPEAFRLHAKKRRYP